MGLRDDELKLIAAIGDGPFEESLWATFLTKLREMTNAHFSTLHYRSPGRLFDEANMLLSGADRSEIEGPNRAKYPPGEPLIDESLIEGRPYTLDELLRNEETPQTRAFGDYLRQAGVTAVCQLRVQEVSGIFAWLTIVRRGGEDFTNAEIAIMRMSAPFLRTALRHFVALERERFGASLTAQAVRGLFCWITLDRTGEVLDADEQGEILLVHSGHIRRGRNGRLTAKSPKLEREIYNALRQIADVPGERPQAITLNRDPWLDMLIVPARRKSISGKANAVAIAYIHGDNWRSVDRCEQLAQLFRLSPGEARLALALCRGMTISEAATGFGLAVGTARNYCKSIYAKTGARGQPDLWSGPIKRLAGGVIR